MTADVEKRLYDTLKRLLAGEEISPDGLNVGDWGETVTELACTPPDQRLQVFQALDTLHQGALNRLLRDYQESQPAPSRRRSRRISARTPVRPCRPVSNSTPPWLPPARPG